MRNKTAPGMTMARRQLANCSNPKLTRAAKTSGITICVTPPPRLPHPAVVALAVPTQLGANMIEVWDWVITNDARAETIAQRSDQQPHQNRNGDRSDDRVADLGFGQQEILAHHGHQRRDAEPTEETKEECDPGDMKSAHLRRSEIPHLDAGGLVSNLHFLSLDSV